MRIVESLTKKDSLCDPEIVMTTIYHPRRTLLDKILRRPPHNGIRETWFSERGIIWRDSDGNRVSPCMCMDLDEVMRRYEFRKEKYGDSLAS